MVANVSIMPVFKNNSLMDTIRAIETHYAGYRMRSRLEARWAVFFDALAIPWQYELEGFHVGNNCYLPDFYLQLGKHPVWAEVKPTWEAVEMQMDLFSAFSWESQQEIIFLVGTPDDIAYKGLMPIKDKGIIVKSGFYFRWYFKRDRVEAAIFAARSARFGKDGRG
jgi:hypothetical protein